MTNFEKPDIIPGSENTSSVESDPSSADQERYNTKIGELASDLEGLKKDIGEIDPNEVSEDDVKELNNNVLAIVTSFAGVAGLTAGIVQLERYITGSNMSNFEVITSVLSAITGLISMIAYEMGRMDNK